MCFSYCFSCLFFTYLIGKFCYFFVVCVFTIWYLCIPLFGWVRSKETSVFFPVDLHIMRHFQLGLAQTKWHHSIWTKPRILRSHFFAIFKTQHKKRPQFSRNGNKIILEHFFLKQRVVQVFWFQGGYITFPKGSTEFLSKVSYLRKVWWNGKLL